jgi:hypothetical protein
MSFAVFAFLAALAGIQQVMDPFVRHDDYAALLRHAEGYYPKTLSEGRWLNYFWILRPFDTPHWLNYALYQGGWSIFCACVALHASRTKSLFYVGYLALLLAVSPQAISISGWFNTLVPGTWTLAAYAFLTLLVSPKLGVVLLLVFIPISLLTYSTYPLMFLSICLIRADAPRTLAALVTTVAVFVTSFALGLTLINLLNYLEHGVFGLEIAEWRTPNPLSSIEDLLRNARLIPRFFAQSATMIGFGNEPHGIFNLTVFAISLFLLGRQNLRDLVFVLAALFVGFGLLVAHILLEGTTIPFRATLFFWLLIAATISMAAEAQSDRSSMAASVGRIILMTLTFYSSYLAHRAYATYNDWQRSTLELAAGIPGAQSTAYIYGSYIALEGGLEAGIQDARGLRLRLFHLTGANVILCRETPEFCMNTNPPFDPVPRFGDGRLKSDESTVFIRLPALDHTP